MKVMTAFDAWAFSRLLCGHDLGAELGSVSRAFTSLASRLEGLAPVRRLMAWDAALSLLEEGHEGIIHAVAAANPEGPPPAMDEPRRPANLGDIRRVMAREQWLWEGWIPKSRIAGISAAEGVGKTRLAVDLARCIWFGLPWPDGQPPSLPSETPTLWICSDGQQDDLVTNAGSFGMPDHSIHFNTLPEDPYGGTDIDSEASIELLETFITQVRYGLVFIDSLTFATSRDLCAANHVKDLMTPVRDLSQRTQTTILPLLHVSKDGQALGKRIKGIARTIIQLECFNPEVATRLRMSVSKSFAKKPPALGVTITDQGNIYDPNPPSPDEAGVNGRPAESRNEAIAFILTTLTLEGHHKATELCKRWEAKGKNASSFWRARTSLVEEGKITCEGKPKSLALKPSEPLEDSGEI